MEVHRHWGLILCPKEPIHFEASLALEVLEGIEGWPNKNKD